MHGATITAPASPSKRNELVAYLQGILDCLAVVNSFENDTKSYTIVLLEKNGLDPQQTIKDHLQVKRWEIKTEKIITPWRATLKKELRPWFIQFISQSFTTLSHCLDENNCKMDLESKRNNLVTLREIEMDEVLLSNILDCLELVTGQTPECWRIGWIITTRAQQEEGLYDNSYHDYYFDLEASVLFLHVGTVD